jgi:hypothetical protein
MKFHRNWIIPVVAVVVVVGVVLVFGLILRDRSAYKVSINPARFTTAVTNPFYPLPSGARWTYEEHFAKGDIERVVVKVTPQTRKVMGVTCLVIRDTVRQDNVIIEDTQDWFAQDSSGNVWYFGEDTKEFKDGKVSSTLGSWEAGVNGALPGIIMKAHPMVGDQYRQEYLHGAAEDMAKVLSLTERVTVPAGSFDNVLMTEETTRLQPGAVEHKYYASGVGPVLSVSVKRGGRSELVEYLP